MKLRRFFASFLFIFLAALLCTVNVLASVTFHNETKNVLIRTDGGNTKYIMEEGTILVCSKADGSIVYADQFPINEEGGFEYKFKFKGNINDYNLYIRDTYGNPMQQAVTTTVEENVLTVLLSVELDHDALYIADDEKARLKATISNTFGDEKPCKLILAMYNEAGALISCRISDTNSIRYEAKTYTELFEVSVPKNTAVIKAFMLSGAATVSPIVKNAEQSFSDYITLPNIISDNMLIQANQPVKIWGKASYVGETISAVITGGTGETLTSGASVVRNDGTFSIEMPATSAAENCKLKVYTAEEEKTVNNVLIGELWLMGGQSNMELKVKELSASVKNQIIPSSPINSIRLFTARATDDDDNTVHSDASGAWVVASAETVGNFSAVGYVAIKEIHDRLGVPAGGIDTSTGGTSMAYWLSAQNAKGYKAGAGFNKKIAPFTNMNVKGIMWYQGEHGDDRVPLTNDNYDSFVNKFDNLIGSWRNAWNKQNLPVVFVELPVGDTDFSKVRLAQLKAYKTISNTAMAVTVDCIPDPVSYPTEQAIHYHNKIPVGKRVAFSALKHFYNYSIHDGAGPMLESVRFTGGNAVLTFSNTEGGLTTNDGENPRYFTLAGSDGVFYPAVAEITSSDTVTVHSSSVAAPEAVRYLMEYDDGFCDPNNNNYPHVNFVNAKGIPCGTFVGK